LGIKILNLNDVDQIDLTIDGADEVDKNLNGIKGGGGALLYEKIVANASQKVIWIVDSSKFVEKLGRFPLPVEIISFGSKQLFNRFDELGFRPQIRKNGSNNFITDSGNLIVDLHLNEINDAIILERQIKLMHGVVEVGLFNNIADTVIVGKEKSTEIFSRK